MSDLTDRLRARLFVSVEGMPVEGHRLSIPYEEYAETVAALEKQAAEIERLTAWADGFSDAQLKERQTGELYQRELRSEIERRDAEIERLRSVLAGAVEVIKTWHNMGGAESVWPIYWRSAPEMQPIRAALERKP